jgi:hypothetical protein
LTDVKQARKTVVIVGAALIAFGGISFARHHLLRAEILAGGGALLLVLALIAPRATAPLHNAWMEFAAVLGWINSRLLLSLMYYGVMTPLGLVLRVVVGRDPMNRRRRPAESYWIPRSAPRQAREQFERQF